LLNLWFVLFFILVGVVIHAVENYLKLPQSPVVEEGKIRIERALHPGS
jgi:hypothetical protein